MPVAYSIQVTINIKLSLQTESASSREDGLLGDTVLPSPRRTGVGRAFLAPTSSVGSGGQGKALLLPPFSCAASTALETSLPDIPARECGRAQLVCNVSTSEHRTTTDFWWVRHVPLPPPPPPDLCRGHTIPCRTGCSHGHTPIVTGHAGAVLGPGPSPGKSCYHEGLMSTTVLWI